MSVNICRGVNVRYIARARSRGSRHLTLLSKRGRVQFRRALSDLASAFDKNANYTYGDVLMLADWYDPRKIVEMKRTA